MPKGMSKSTAIIQRLLEERRQYEAWIARLNSSADDAGERAGARARGLRGPARRGDGGAQGSRRERAPGDPGKALYARGATEKGGARRREAHRDRAAPFGR